MRAYLELELVGDDTYQLFKFYKNVTEGLIGLGNEVFGKVPPTAWVAEITAFDAKYKYTRHFMRFKKDYSRSNSKGSRGVYAEYLLESGQIYEVKERKERYFCKVDDAGEIVKITEEEVIAWLKNRSV